MGFPRWSTKTSITTNCGGDIGGPTPKPSLLFTTRVDHHQNGSSTGGCWCSGLSKLVMKLFKKQRRQLVRMASRRSSSNFECGYYDPLSYSLNFDSGLVNEEEYYRFYAFSVRFVATIPPASSPSVL